MPMFRHFEGAIHLAPTGSRFKPFFEHDFEKLELIKAVVDIWSFIKAGTTVMQL